jgi:hypothetical protein
VTQGTMVTGTSFESFADAATQAFKDVPGDGPEGSAAAEVRREWLSKGGVVGRQQFHVELEVLRPEGDTPA